MNKNRAAGLLFLIGGIYGSVLSLQLPLGNWREPGPGMLPLGLSMLLFISGLLWLVFGKGEKEGKMKEGKAPWHEIVQKLTTPLKILGVTFGFILLLERLGYLLTASLYLFLLFFWISRYRWWLAIGLSFMVGVGSWYFFGKILSVRLPQGFLPL